MNELQTMTEAFAPEAEEFVEMLVGDGVMQVTQNNYGRAMGMVGMIPEGGVMRAAFVNAMELAGYPPATAAFLRGQFNLPGQTDSQAVLMGLA